MPESREPTTASAESRTELATVCVRDYIQAQRTHIAAQQSRIDHLTLLVRQYIATTKTGAEFKTSSSPSFLRSPAVTRVRLPRPALTPRPSSDSLTKMLNS